MRDNSGVLSKISNWFSDSSSGDSRNLAQYYDANYGIMADTQYQTYYNYGYGDLYNAVSGDNYNYNTNVYNYYSTTQTSTVAYSKTYIPPTVSTTKPATKGNTATAKSNQNTKKTNNKKPKGTTTKSGRSVKYITVEESYDRLVNKVNAAYTKPDNTPKSKEWPNGNLCSAGLNKANDYDCASRCCR